MRYACPFFLFHTLKSNFFTNSLLILIRICVCVLFLYSASMFDFVFTVLEVSDNATRAAPHAIKNAVLISGDNLVSKFVWKFVWAGSDVCV